MMKNERGFISVAVLLAIVLCGSLVLFTPNPIRSTLGLEQKPNTIVQKESHEEKLVPVMVNGEQVGFKTVTHDTVNASDKAPKDWLNTLLALPRLWLILMVAGLFCPALGLFMANLNGKIKTVAQTAYDDLTGEAKTIVVSVKAALETIKDPVIKQTFLDTLSKYQDKSTKDLVKDLLK